MEIRCHYHRAKLAMYAVLLSLAIFIPIAMLVVVEPAAMPWWGTSLLLLMLIVSAIGLVAIGRRLLDREPQLIVNKHGFFTKRPTPVTIPWDNIEDIAALREVETTVAEDGRESNKVSAVVKVWVKEVTITLNQIGMDESIPDIGGNHRYAPFWRDISALKPGQRELEAFLRQAKSKWLTNKG